MSAVAVTAANIGIANHQGIRLRSVIAGGALNGGDSVYIDTNGVAQKATSADATHAQLFGVCLPMASGSGAGKAAGGGASPWLSSSGARSRASRSAVWPMGARLSRG